MRITLRVVVAALAALLATPPAFAQPAPAVEPPLPGPDPMDLSKLDEMLNTLVIQVASKRKETARETAGIVTIVPRDEIVASGARDLYELLHLIPGFAFGVDVGGVVGVGFRGLWGHEGKVLLLVDGVEMNETLYSTTQLGNHIPVHAIKRLEIVRGPGSAIYGGFAELAVINVVTREGWDLKGVSAQTQLSTTALNREGASTLRWNLNLSGGTEIERIPGLSLSLHAGVGEGVRSGQVYRDFEGKQLSLAENSQLRMAFVNLGARYRDLKLRFIYDGYSMRTGTGVGAVSSTVDEQRFDSYAVDLQYSARIGQKITLTPRLSYKHQTPWQVVDKRSDFFYDKSADRALASLILAWDIFQTQHLGLDVLVGVEGFLDHAKLNDPEIVGFQTNFLVQDTSTETKTREEQSILYGNVAGFAQVAFRNPIANLTAGARYQYHTEYGNAFVPRVGLTRVLGRFNFKLLYSRAFRAPGFENINLAPRNEDGSPNIKPETIDVAEAEVGVQLSPNVFVTTNAFWMRLHDPIVYRYNQELDAEVYENFNDTGTAGVEAELRIKSARGFMTLNYSFYSAASQSQADVYTVPGRDDLLLGFAAHKVALNSSFNITPEHLTLGVTGTLLTDRYGTLRGTTDEEGNLVGVVESDGVVLLLNTILTYRDLGLKGLDLSFGIYNLLGQRYRMLQPYRADHPPLPTTGREIFFRLSYDFQRG